MDFPKRKSPRIPGFDYSSVNYYFVTICTHDKQCIFGNPGDLNWMGKIAEENLCMISVLYPQIKLDKYVVMPNHIHAILAVTDDGMKVDISTVLGQYKMSVTKKIRIKKPEFMVWQRSYHDHVIRNQAGYEKIWTYIDSNPLKWEEDCFYVSASRKVSQREGQ